MDKGAQHTGLHLETPGLDSRGGRNKIAVTNRLGETVDVGIESVPKEVIGQRHAPPRQHGILVGGGEVHLALLVEIVDFQLLVVVVHIVGAVEGVLDVVERGEVAQSVSEVALREGVGVPYALAAPPHVVHDSARHTALRIVVVYLEMPLAAVELAVDIGLEARGVDIAVLTHGGGVVGQLAGRIHAAVAELVFAAGVYPLRTERHIHLPRKAELHKSRRVDEVE